MIADRVAAVYPALQMPRKMLGVERRLANWNAALLVIFVISMRLPWMAVVNVAVHAFLGWLTTRHPDLLDQYLRYRRQADYYRSWVSLRGQRYNRRPAGFGRL